MWFGIFVPRSVVIGQGMAGAGAALLAILVVVGMIHAFLVGVFSAIAAAIATIGLMIADRAFNWDAEFERKTLFRVLLNAFMAMTLVTWLLDLVLHTYFSVPTMIVSLDRLICDPYCSTFTFDGTQNVVKTVPDYYRYFVAGADGGWLRYLLQNIPGFLAFAWVLGSGEPDAFQPRQAPANIALPSPGGRFAAIPERAAGERLLRLAIASAACVGAALIVAFPIFIQLMIGLRSLAR